MTMEQWIAADHAMWVPAKGGPRANAIGTFQGTNQHVGIDAASNIQGNELHAAA